MSTLAGTTWKFRLVPEQLQGEIAFQKVGPSPNAGVATITATNLPVGYNGATEWTASWSETPDGNHFAVQFSNFGTQDGYNPPPLGLPTINSGQADMQPVTLWGSHQGGQMAVYGTNFQTPGPYQHIVTFFNMRKTS